MKIIEWVGETRMIPYYGIGEKGLEKTLPDDMADNFVTQGLAKHVTQTKKVNKSGGK